MESGISGVSHCSQLGPPWLFPAYRHGPALLSHVRTLNSPRNLRGAVPSCGVTVTT